MAITLDHIHFRCHDQVEVANWFISNLEGREVGRGDIMGWPVFRVKVGGQVITFSPAKEGQVVEENSGQPRYGMYQLGLKVDDLDGTISDLKAKGVSLKAGPIDISEGLRVAFVEGPEEIEIELMEMA